jgi:hypothetical protein
MQNSILLPLQFIHLLQLFYIPLAFVSPRVSLVVDMFQLPLQVSILLIHFIHLLLHLVDLYLHQVLLMLGFDLFLLQELIA